jgi:hypothetical protein
VHVNTAFWRLGRSRLKIALAPPTIRDSETLAAFEETARREGCLLAAAFGAPLLYRQNGYAFAVPTLGGMQLRLSQAPSEIPRGYSLRPPTLDDIPAIAAWYEALVAPLDVWAERAEMSLPGIYVIIRQDEPSGYVRLGHSNQVTAVYELAARDVDGLSAAMAFARAEAEKTGAHRMALHLPPTHPALTLAGYVGAETLPDEAFQGRVLDERAFLLALAGELAGRLAGGPMAGFDGRLMIDLYARRLALVFSDGALHEVAPADSEETWDILLPPPMAAQLWLGWRSRAELEAWHPDVRVRGGMQLAIDMLFPKLSAYIYGPPHQEVVAA